MTTTVIIGQGDDSRCYLNGKLYTNVTTSLTVLPKSEYKNSEEGYIYSDNLPPSDFESICKYLYEHHYDDIWAVNENQSIRYYTNDTKDCLIGTYDFYRGFDIICISGDIDMTHLNGYKDLDQQFHRTIYEKMSYDVFKKQVRFLEDIYGEYGDSIFAIMLTSKNNNYVIDCRIEREKNKV